MAFGSGSSLATDCWIMRGGSPSSEKALKVGSATRLHQHSSKKPMAHRGSASALSISRSLASLAFFSFVQGIWGGDPPLGPLPAYAQKPREGGADGLPRDPLFGEALLEGGLGGHISRVHRLLSYPNSLGERCSIPRSRSAEFASKAACRRFGVEEPAMSASKPFSLKARIALQTVCEAHPRLSAILGGELPRALASSIWQRRITKVSLERSPASRHSRSFSDNFRTYIGGFMKRTIAHHTQPSLSMH